MKRLSYVRKALITLLCCILTAGLLTACGKSEATEDEEVSEDAASEGEPSDDNTSELSGDVALFAETGVDGEWVMIYSLYHSDYGDGEEYNSCTMATDEYAPTSKIKIYQKDGKYIADYKYNGYESVTKYYGNEIKYLDEPAYEECEDSDWCFTLVDPFGDDEESKRFTLKDKDTLIAASEYRDSGEDYAYYAVYQDVYIRSDDPRLENEEDLRYFDTVTVSSAEELLNSLQDNRKIILKAGTYDLSKVEDAKMNNERVNLEWGAYKISNVYNICIEAEEGADVLICVDDAYSPVMTFYGCGNVTLRGITAGHNVEPGYCSGSVIQLEQTSGTDIDKCKLYGCGTYGVSASNCDRLNVTDSEIYECTYGLLDLSGVYNANFSNCIFRDSKDMSMINLYSSSDISFDNCTFKNNLVSSEYWACYFVELSEYSDVTFNKCSFENNQYDVFANSKVKMNNCRVSDNGDMTNVETEADADSSELRRKYNETCDAQKQIDLKFEGGNMDQATMNQTAYEEYSMWDTLLNDIWAYLKDTMDEHDMEQLTEEETSWIKEKEAAVLAAGAEFEGGSMQPTAESRTAASITRERVEYLLDNYVK
ncbi:MAG: right-handed parallel beta-helix repeat-containing protein [Lachnospiraceae bacterium]|nr:right-handed parallel beta-helix repeat-containing protein [Lachnospiraceae bacterium]